MIVSPFGNADWQAIVPPAIIAIAALVVLLFDLASRGSAKRYVSIGIALAGTLGAGIAAALQYHVAFSAFGGAFVTGGFTTVFEEVVVLALLGSIALYGTTGIEDRVPGSLALLLWAGAGAAVMAGAASLMTIFLGLELLSLALYCLCAMSENAAGRESALKYLILSSTASAFLLFGMALLFGASGSVLLADLANASLAASPIYWMGWGMLAIGLVFKMSLAPFHAWAPDVFEGAPLPITAFMSVATKAGAIAVLARFIYAALPSEAAAKLLIPVWIVAAISMIVGNVGMLAQTDLKRLMAYSSIAQVGYILTALAGGTTLGLRYAVYYLAAYTLMNLGAFAVAGALSTEAEQGSPLATYRGLGRRRPLLATAMTLFMLALAGLPPTAGFLGKILLLSAGVASGYAWLAVVLIVGTAISLYAYGKVVRAMWEREPRAAAEAKPFAPLAWISLAFCFVGLIAMTFYPLTPSAILPLVR